MKYIILGVICSILSALLQCMYLFTSNIFLVFTIFTSIPIYIITRKKPTIGLLAYIGSLVIVILLSNEANLLFIFINGFLGLFLGLFSYYTNKRAVVSVITGIIFSIILLLDNFSMEVNIFESIYNFSIMSQSLLIIFSIAYSYATISIGNLLYRKMYFLFK